MKAAETSAELALRMEALATALAGKQPTSRTRTELRYGSKGALAVEIGGAGRGKWFDHQSGTGGDALALVCHLRGGSVSDALKWARDWLGNHSAAAPKPKTKPAPAPLAPEAANDDRKKTDAARQIWIDSVSPIGTIVERYLGTRALKLPASDALRFHPRCPNGTDRLPAMVALMTDPVTGTPGGVHRTFVAPDGSGKAAIEKQKMMLGRAGVIRLSADEDVVYGLGIAEGIETALSMLQVAQWAPVWACCSAGAMTRFPVLAGIDALTVFADADKAGLKAAHNCADRWVAAGREARVIRPRAGGDWNDIARTVTP